MGAMDAAGSELCGWRRRLVSEWAADKSADVDKCVPRLESRSFPTAIGLKNPLRDIEGKLQDDDGADHAESELKALINLLKSLAVAQLIGCWVFQQNVAVIGCSEQKGHRDEADRFADDLQHP